MQAYSRPSSAFFFDLSSLCFSPSQLSNNGARGMPILFTSTFAILFPNIYTLFLLSQIRVFSPIILICIILIQATMICIDNSEWMRNGDYSPTRFQAQADAVNLICGAKTQVSMPSVWLWKKKKEEDKREEIKEILEYSRRRFFFFFSFYHQSITAFDLWLLLLLLFLLWQDSRFSSILPNILFWDCCCCIEDFLWIFFFRERCLLAIWVICFWLKLFNFFFLYSPIQKILWEFLQWQAKGSEFWSLPQAISARSWRACTVCSFTFFSF